MLVYASTLWIAREADRNKLLTVVAKWLAIKTKTPITASDLTRTGEPRMRDGSRLSVISSDDAFPQMSALRYSHPDAEVSGRQWLTEIGLRRQRADDPIECSIILQTREISARVTSPVRATRPGIIRDIAAAGLLTTGTPGRQLQTLTDDPHTAEAFLYGIEAERRKYPYVLISPDPAGKYLIDPEKTRSLLIGLAEVVVIPPEADTFFLGRVLGAQFAAWRGAVNIIFPKVQFPDRTFIENRRLRADDLSDLVDKGSSAESEILSIITHRTNLPLSWRAISLDRVQEAMLRRELTHRLQEAKKSGDQSEYVRLLEENDIDQSKKIAELNTLLETADEELSVQRDTERRLRYDLEQATGAREDAPAGVGVGETSREDLLSVIQRRATPEQTLSAILTLFPDRLEILSSAWKSVKASDGFTETERLFELLQKLATDYWQDMNRGKGDTDAGNTFGTA